MQDTKVLEIAINKVKSNGRIRKSIGSLQTLIESIEETGILFPIIIDKKRNLICGARRLQAFIKMGRKKIPYRIMDLDSFIAEKDENIVRKNFTKIECLYIYNAVIEREKAKAKSRQGSRTDKHSVKFTESMEQSRDSAAKATGLSWRTLDKIQEIVDYGNESLIEKMDSGPVNDVHKTVLLKKKYKSEMSKIRKFKQVPLPKTVKLYNKDFITSGALVEDSSISLLFCDPPYNKDALPLYGFLAKFGKRVLKENGILIVYAGTFHIDEIFKSMTKYLHYEWCLALLTGQAGKISVMTKGIFQNWKPLLMFAKKKNVKKNWLIEDVIKSIKPDKTLHIWRQGSHESNYLISHICPVGETVCDPMFGMATTALSCLKKNCKFIGFEKDKRTFKKAENRIKHFIATGKDI